MKGKLKIYEAKKITWWQDCPPATHSESFQFPKISSYSNKEIVGAKRIKF